MNKECKEVALKVADYADAEKKLLLKRVCIINVIGLFALDAATFFEINDLAEKNPFCEAAESVGFGFAFGTMIVTLLYTTGILAKIREKKKIGV